MSSNITVVGNLTREPELRYTPGGSGVANFGIAVNRRWQSNGEWQESTSFFNVVAWRELAENCAASLEKGARVIVSGRLEQRSWDKDGEKQSTVEIVADEIGPSLRWATASIERTEREKPETPRKGSGKAASQPIYADEEPF